MIFLSAQPDEYYFLWQLELQLYNFISLGIKPEQIHILVGYDIKKGISNEFKSFKIKNQNANIFFYEDSRIHNNYLSSIRPHIIAKHFKQFSFLQEENIFYHDSDIILSKLPDFNTMVADKYWYVSDTQSYLNTDYIIRNSNLSVFANMCELIGIDQLTVKNNDENAGGAQYLIKNCKAIFWEKIESDCEILFDFLSTYKSYQGFANKNKNIIDPWLTDMWVIFWNILILNIEVKIHKEIEFCWASSPIEEFYTKNILHYTGHIKIDDKTLFRKNNYYSCNPYYINFSEINKQTCSYALVNVINDFNNAKKKDRIEARDLTFIISSRIDADYKLYNVYNALKYLIKNFNTNILFLEADVVPKINEEYLDSEITYVFVPDSSLNFQHTKYNNYLINRCNTPYICIYDFNTVIPVNQLLNAIKILRQGEFFFILPHQEFCLSVDALLKAMFDKLMDENFLISNINKLNMHSQRLKLGCILMDRKTYLTAGGENENLKGEVITFLERIKRLIILGFRVEKIEGLLFYFNESRSPINHDNEELFSDKEEYLKVANYSKKALKNYIKNW